MSATTQAIELIDDLVKDNISKQTATKLIDYADRKRDKGIDKKRDKNIDRLWIAMGILTAVMIGGFVLLSDMIKDTRAEIKDTRQELKAEIKEIKTELKENRKLLLQLIQKKD